MEKSTFFFRFAVQRPQLSQFGGMAGSVLVFREPVKVPSESNTGSLNLPFYGNSLAFSCRIPITQVRGSSKSPCCSTHEQTLSFFCSPPSITLPPAKATLQVITTITPVAHTRTPELCYAADENAMEEKAGFTTSDHKKKMTSDPLHGEVPRRSHLLFASTSLRRKKTDVAFRFSIRFSISESSVRPVSPPHLCARPNGPVGQHGFRTIEFQSFRLFLRDCGIDRWS